MQKDLSNKTIAFLIIASLVITVVGTWLILEKFDSLNPIQTKASESASTSGELRFDVQAKKTDKGKSAGDVVVNII